MNCRAYDGHFDWRLSSVSSGRGSIAPEISSSLPSTSAADGVDHQGKEKGTTVEAAVRAFAKNRNRRQTWYGRMQNGKANYAILRKLFFTATSPCQLTIVILSFALDL